MKPPTQEIERKFLVRSVDLSHPALWDAEIIGTEQIYLCSSGSGEARIRKRTLEGKSTYIFTRKWDTLSATTRFEEEEEIGVLRYWLLRLFRKRRGTGVIHKTRYCFIWSGQGFELDVFRRPRGLILLEIELESESDNVLLPSFVEVVREVTDEPRYRNSVIAERV